MLQEVIDGLKYKYVRKQSVKQIEEKSIRAVECKDADAVWGLCFGVLGKSVSCRLEYAQEEESLYI